MKLTLAGIAAALVMTAGSAVAHNGSPWHGNTPPRNGNGAVNEGIWIAPTSMCYAKRAEQGHVCYRGLTIWHLPPARTAARR
jgi:hypothetical protein